MKKQGQLSNQIKKLQYQLSYSEHINKQISAQLATFCTKLGIVPTKFKQDSDIKVINNAHHLHELYYVQPLLMCYEETIHLLKTELDDSKEQAKVILQNVENIVKQNNFIRKQLQSKIQLLSKNQNLGLNSKFLHLQISDLKDKVAILTSKNQFLTRKNNQLMKQIQKARNQNSQMFSKHDMDKLENQAKQENKQKQILALNYKNQIHILNNKYENEHNICVDLQKKISNLQHQIIKLRNQVKISKQQKQNIQLISDKAKQNIQSQLLNIKQQLSNSMRKQQQIFTKSMVLQSELQDKSNKIHNLTVQNNQLQSNNNNMLQMLQSYEVKVSTLNKKIKKMESDIKQMNNDKSQCLKRCEVAEWKLNEKLEYIERRETEWKQETARMNKMWETRLQATRKNYQQTPHHP